MSEKRQIYKCPHCGSVFELLHAGVGPATCCGETLEPMTEKTADAGFEKHVPVVDVSDGSANIEVGSVPHPMEPDHYIEWIEVSDGTNVYRHFLKPGQDPKASFCLVGNEIKRARELCSVHGLWKA